MSATPGDRKWRHRMRVTWIAATVVWTASPPLLIGLTALSVLSGLTAPAIAWLQRDVLDAVANGFGSGDHRGLAGSEVLVLVVALGASGVVAAIVPQFEQYIQAQLRRAVSVRVTDRAYRAVSSWPGIGRFESPRWADRIQLSGEISQISASSLVSSLLTAIRSAITTISFALTLALISPLLAAATAGIECLAVAASLANANRQAQVRVANSSRSRRQGMLASLLADRVAAQEIRLFGLGAFLRGRMLVELKAANHAEQQLGRRLLGTESGLAAISALTVAGGLIWIVDRVGARALPVGDVSLFILAAMGLQGAMTQIAYAAGNIAQSVALFGAYDEVISAPPDLAVPAHPRPAPPLADGITIQDVWFRYDQSHPWALRELSLFLPAGACTALVGRNGAGKSTLVKLLCRLYDPVRGAIYWDGVDIRELDPVTLRQRIAGLFQDFVCYDLTVAENIGVGDLTRLDDPASVRRAAEAAGAHDDIARLPEGYETFLSRVFRPQPRGGDGRIERVGMALSGGQRQRLALARALMRAGRDLLIVDEPMSSLDAEAEYAMNGALVNARAAGGACVLISHRLASVRAADQIAVLAGGTLAECGTHAELLKAGGDYAHLFKLQASGYVDVVPDGPVPDGPVPGGAPAGVR